MKCDPKMAKYMKYDPNMAKWYLRKQHTVFEGVLRPLWSRAWDLGWVVVRVTRHYQTVYTPLPPSCDYLYVFV